MKNIYKLIIVVILCLLFTGCDTTPHTHEYIETLINPTCEESGYTLYECSCGDTYQDNFISKIEHTEEVLKGYDSTYEATGLTDGLICSVCNNVLKEQEVIAIKEKTYQSINITLNSDGGVIDGYDSSSIIITYKEPTNFPIVTKEYYIFKGWLCNIDNIIYESYPGFKDKVSSVVFVAIWEYDTNSNYELINDVYDELCMEFDTYGMIEKDIVLPTYNEDFDINIEYESTNEEVLDNTGKFNRPYQETEVVMNLVISKGETVVNYTYTFNVKGYKKLENIASTYVYTNYAKLTDEFFDTMDIIYCAFVAIDVDCGFTGKLATGDSIASSNRSTLAMIKEYVLPKAKEKGVYVVASLGGGGSAYDKTFEQICLDNNKIDTLTTNVIDLVNEYGFDGVDIDWEKPDSGCGYKFTNLTKSLYTKIKANNPNHLVTAAIGGGKWQPPVYDLNNSKQYLDYINMMTYSMTSNSGYHHTALYKSSSYFDSINKVGRTLGSCSIEESVKFYKDNYNIDPSQIIIGGAFYGYKQTRTLSNGSYSSWVSSGSVSYDNIKKNYLNNSNYEYFYDTNVQSPYILSKDKLTFITYDDPSSIKAKCDYLMSINAAGIMFWQNGHDTSGELVHALKEGLSK